MLPLQMPMKWVKKRIQTANPEELTTVIQTVISCHKKHFPESELLIWSLPVGNRPEMEQQIELVTRFLHRLGQMYKTLKRYRF